MHGDRFVHLCARAHHYDRYGSQPFLRRLSGLDPGSMLAALALESAARMTATSVGPLGTSSRSQHGPILVIGASGSSARTCSGRSPLCATTSSPSCAAARTGGSTTCRDEHHRRRPERSTSATKNMVDRSRPADRLQLRRLRRLLVRADRQLIYQTNFSRSSTWLTPRRRRTDVARRFVHAGSSSEYGDNCAAPARGGRCALRTATTPCPRWPPQLPARFMGKQQRLPVRQPAALRRLRPLEDSSRLIPTLVRSALAGNSAASSTRASRATSSTWTTSARPSCAPPLHLRPDFYGESFNIGTGQKTTIGDLAADWRASLFGIAARAGVRNHGRAHAGTWPDWYANPRKANAQLEWTAPSALQDGLRADRRLVSRACPTAEHAAATKKDPNTPKHSVTRDHRLLQGRPGDSRHVRPAKDTFTKLEHRLRDHLRQRLQPRRHGRGHPRLISRNDPHVIGISHSRNFGSQSAFRSGMEVADEERRACCSTAICRIRRS